MLILTIFLLFHDTFGVIAKTINLNKKGIISNTKYVISSNKEQIVGQIRYHYKEGTNNENQCTSIVTFGVGTAMSVNNYDYISHRIALLNPTIVVIVTDSNHDGIVKSSPTKYATLLNTIHNQIDVLIPVCNNSDLFLGGHSTSGQAALQALQGNLFQFTPAGFIGLDPYEISSETVDYTTPINLPSLNWGFTKTTCSVNVNKAALGAYHLFAPASSNGKTLGRVLYIANNDSKQIGHCIFTDHGCGVGPIDVCPTIEPLEDNWMYDSLARSVSLFLKAMEKGIPFTKHEFDLTGNFSIHVNDDEFGRDSESII